MRHRTIGEVPGSGLVVAIDGSNIRAGGGLTHLSEIVAQLDGVACGVEKVVVFASNRLADRLESRPGLSVVRLSHLSARLFSVTGMLDHHLAALRPDILLVAGTSYLGSFRPYVTIAQNLLPFVCLKKYMITYGDQIRFLLLRIIQKYSIVNAQGCIHMSGYARQTIERSLGVGPPDSIVVYHGVNPRFQLNPQDRSKNLSTRRGNRQPFTWIYVSAIEPYKHHDVVVNAVMSLVEAGHELRLDIIGHGRAKYVGKLHDMLRRRDPNGKTVKYHGSIPYDHLQSRYASADGFIYASSCETFGLTLVEALAAGVPILAANTATTPEIAGDAAEYFDLELGAVHLEQKILAFMADDTRRMQLRICGRLRAKAFSWQRCSYQTFQYLSNVVARRARGRSQVSI